VLKVIALIVPLSLDTFAVCAALGVAGLTPTQRRRISILFPLLEGTAPLVGLGLGAALGAAIGDASDYLAVGVLVVLGLVMVLGADEETGRARQIVSARGAAILALALTSSLDELAIGFTIGLLGLPLVPVLALIVAQSIVVTQLGMRLGARAAPRLREAGERIAGLALLAIAAALVVEKLVTS
jgi:manganese efflux pump family protein